ncbi:MAG: hypothetical protein WC916_04600 [Candidatus Woesearchaeota archaeon]
MKLSTKSHSSYAGVILLIIVCTLFTSIGQLLLKLGSSHTNSIIEIVTNIPLIFGLISYAFGAVLLILALKYGELSLIYPFIALSFIWVNLLSLFIFHEYIAFINWIGIIAIVIGVSLIGYGGHEHRKAVKS